jgi:hypothetical protein
VRTTFLCQPNFQPLYLYNKITLHIFSLFIIGHSSEREVIVPIAIVIVPIAIVAKTFDLRVDTLSRPLRHWGAIIPNAM